MTNFGSWLIPSQASSVGLLLHRGSMGAGSHSGVPSSLSSRWKKKKMSSYIIIILLIGRHSLSETSSFILLFDVDGFCLCWRPPLSLYSCPLGGVLSFIHLPDYWGSSHYSFHLQRCALNTSLVGYSIICPAAAWAGPLV